MFWPRAGCADASRSKSRTAFELNAPTFCGSIIRKAVDALPLELRAVFVVYALEEMSMEECADILDLPTRTVNEQLQSATLAIRHAIGWYFARGLRKSNPLPKASLAALGSHDSVLRTS
jgi:hypothetical protein